MSDRRNEDRLNDLLADRAVFGLDADEAEELSKLISLTDKSDDDSFDIAAAVVDLSMNQPESMPANLSKKLAEQGHAVVANEQLEQTSANGMSSDEELTDHTLSDHSSEDPSNPVSPQRVSQDGVAPEASLSGRMREIVAWGCAAAIGFIALMVWNNYRSDMNRMEKEVAVLRDKNNEITTSYAELELVNSELTKKLYPDGKEIYERLAKKEDIIHWDWSATGDSEGTGEVIWDEDNQEGVMRLVNLEVNDPEVSQYQLWIIEEGRRMNPVDGGVFDIKEKGEIFVPVNSKLFAQDAVTFAITVEKPGGVVVSNRDKLPLLAVAPKVAND